MRNKLHKTTRPKWTCTLRMQVFMCSLIVCLPHFDLPDGFNKVTWTLVLSVSPVGLV